MKIWITQPQNHAETALNERLRQRWLSVVPKALGLRFLTAETGENHGALLTRIWQIILNDDDPLHVISELDFIPYGMFVSEMANLLASAPAVFVEYVTRDKDLVLRRHAPLSGAWLIGINKDLIVSDLPLHWLDAGGPFNDAANWAYPIYPYNEGAVFEAGSDEAPQSLGMEYEGLGYHCFFQRHFSAPPTLQLFPGYTLARHLKDITARLDILEPVEDDN